MASTIGWSVPSVRPGGGQPDSTSQGETRDGPSEMRESPPDTPAELSQQAVKNRDSLRVSNFKFIVACYLVILSLLTIVLHTGFNPMP